LEADGSSGRAASLKLAPESIAARRRRGTRCIAGSTIQRSRGGAVQRPDDAVYPSYVEKNVGSSTTASGSSSGCGYTGQRHRWASSRVDPA
jgi:hypothetical protein